MKKNIIIAVVIIAIIAGGAYAYLNRGNEMRILTPEEAKAKVEVFINDNLMQAGQTATVKEITEENGLYKLVLDIGTGQNLDTYVTKDGNNFFPQVMNITEIEEQTNQTENNAAAANQQPAATVPNKKDKPTVELFVMSHCPYGTQIEKGIIPVLETLGDKIDFELKFCDYAMHGKKELDEQLIQYCIQKEQDGKLLTYLNCFLKAGDSSTCLIEAGINQSQLDSCVSAADKQYKVTELYNDQSSWRNGSYPQFNIYQADAQKYGVTGSPGLVINGQKISSSRDANGLLKTICSAFGNQPAECSKTLSSTTPSPGFGEGTAASSSGSCN